MKAWKFVALALILSGSSAFSTVPRLEDRTSTPSRSAAQLQTFAKFDFPPGHVTISRGGRMFMDALTMDSKATHQVIELVEGKLIPFPAIEVQRKFRTVHGLFVDAADRLWILDHSYSGLWGAPHLYAYDIKTGAEIANYAFPREIAGRGSMINDLVVDSVRNKIYISDTSPIARKSGIIVFDIAKRSSRRVLHDHPSVRDAGRKIYVEGKIFSVLGLVKPTFGIDGIALDPSGAWLYYAPFNGGELFRVAADKVADENLSADAVGSAVEKVADITMTDGILVDADQRVYLSDVEHSAVVRQAGGKLETLYKNPIYAWPTGFAAAGDGWIYFTCNAIQDTQLRKREHILERGPYFMYRFRP